MHIESLKVYCDVVETRSFSSAAERNGITQSAVSQKLRNLEQQFGVKFILREAGRTEKVTPEGRVFYDACKEIVAAYGSISSRLLRLQGALRGEVRVATVPSLGLLEVAEARRRFRRRYPGVRVETRYLERREVPGVLEAGEADFAVLAWPEKGEGFEVEICWQDKLLLVCPIQHRLARYGTVGLKDLRGERFVHCHPDGHSGEAMQRIFERAKVEVDALFVVRNVESAMRAVDVEGALTILPEGQAPEMSDRYRRVEVNAQDMWRPVGVVRKKGSALSPAALELVRVLRR